ncbi:MAG: phenylalanine--tRNA ligase subunit beta, partial [Solirubrobacterales bacterium]
AQRLASRLMIELCGAKLVPGTIDVTAEPPAPRRLLLRAERVEGLLGMFISQTDQQAYLERLGFEATPAGDDLEVVVPPDRHYDVTREVDLIEEVARVHGIDEHLPTTLPAVGGAVGGLSPEQRLRRRAEDALRDLGFDQAVGWSFTDPAESERLRIPADDPRAKSVMLANPLSEDQSAMRTTLLGSLLDITARNTARGTGDLALFESTRVYLQKLPTGLEPTDMSGNRPVDPLAGRFAGDQPAPFVEPHRFAGIAVGALTPRSWGGGGEAADFFAVKGVLEALAAQLGTALDFAPGEEPFLHPGRAAAVSAGGASVGWLGEVHPLVCRTWDLDAAVAFELDAAPLLAAATLGEERYEDVTTFPAIYQDLAVVVPVGTPAAEVRAAVLAGGGELLRAAVVFDLYEGEQLGEDRESLALNLEFRAPDRTLTDEEVSGLREAIKTKLDAIGGTLRE